MRADLQKPGAAEKVRPVRREYRGARQRGVSPEKVKVTKKAGAVKPRRLFIPMKDSTNSFARFRRNRFDLSVLFLIFFDGISDEHKNLAVHAAAFIIRHNMQFIQHFLFNPDRNTFYSHTAVIKSAYTLLINLGRTYIAYCLWLYFKLFLVNENTWSHCCCYSNTLNILTFCCCWFCFYYSIDYCFIVFS